MPTKHTPNDFYKPSAMPTSDPRSPARGPTTLHRADEFCDHESYRSSGEPTFGLGTLLPYTSVSPEGWPGLRATT